MDHVLSFTKYILNPRTWTVVDTQGDLPSPRSFHKMVALGDKVKLAICLHFAESNCLILFIAINVQA